MACVGEMRECIAEAHNLFHAESRLMRQAYEQ